MVSGPEWGSEDRVTDLRNMIAQAVDRMPDQDVANVFKNLMAAARQDDLTLAATVRENIVIIGFALMAFGGGLKRASGKRPRGRPKKNPLGEIDCRRAYLCWFAVRLYRDLTGEDREITNREAIEFARFFENHAGLPQAQCAFLPTAKDETIEESVSRGKTKLGFSDAWTCKKCEEILEA